MHIYVHWILYLTEEEVKMSIKVQDKKGNEVEQIIVPESRSILTRVNGIDTGTGYPIRINGCLIEPKLFPYMYRLNDIHVASGYSRTYRPSHWLRHDKSKALISALESYTIDTIQPIDSKVQDVVAPEHYISIYGGPNRGTYGSIIVVLEYTGWLCPEFRIEVLSSYLENGVKVDSEAAIILTEDDADHTYDHLLKNAVSIGVFAKSFSQAHPDLKMGRNQVMKVLREEQFLQIGQGVDDPDHNVPYQKWIDRGYFTVKRVKTNSGRWIYQPMITQRGVENITQILNHR